MNGGGGMGAGGCYVGASLHGQEDGEEADGGKGWQMRGGEIVEIVVQQVQAASRVLPGRGAMPGNWHDNAAVTQEGRGADAPIGAERRGVSAEQQQAAPPRSTGHRTPPFPPTEPASQSLCSVPSRGYLCIPGHSHN